MIRAAITVTHSWHREPSGTAVAVNALIESLSVRSDISVVGIGPGGGPPHRSFEPPVRTVRHRLPYPALYESWHSLRRPLPERLVGLVDSGTVDIVHAATTLVPPVRDAALVVTVHDLFPLDDPGGLSRRGARVLTRGIDLARSDAAIVCCPSEQTKQACLTAGFDADRLHVVPWGPRQTTVDEPAVADFAQRHGLTRPYVCWVGAAVPRKNLGTLLAAARSLPNGAELVLAGSPGWGSDIDSALAALGPKARHLGFLDDADLACLLAGAQAAVVPSLAEGFGLPALEAMQLGTPVIASRGTAVGEVVGDTGHLVDARDVNGFAVAMAEALETDWKATRSAAAVDRASEYTWERSAELTIEAYREALGR